MSQNLVAVNGAFFDVAISSLRRTANITDGENAGRTAAPAASMIRDVIGTFYTYVISFELKSGKQAHYDALFAALSRPVDSVNLTVPYGQQRYTFEAYVTKVEDELKANRNGVLIWSGMSVTFTAMEPNITPT